jgi:hypothetical protein
MASVVRFTGLATTPLHLLEIAETTAIQTVERLDDTFVESLVESDHY